jgi:hypothetical protein
MDERELRDSIRESGPVLPAVFFLGEQIDGRRRERLCSELGIAITRKHCESLREACSYLWAIDHQHRAIALADTRNVHELAQLCAARPAAVAKVLRDSMPRPKYVHRNPRQLRGQKRVLVQVWMEPQLKFLAQRAGEREGLQLSAFLREAAWERVQLVDGRAPLPDTTRAPRWVKPRERRNRARVR